MAQVGAVARLDVAEAVVRDVGIAVREDRRLTFLGTPSVHVTGRLDAGCLMTTDGTLAVVITFSGLWGGVVSGAVSHEAQRT